MKKMLLAAAAAALLVAAPAPAKTVTVDISKVGFVPAAVTVDTGDVVTWTNKDTGNHQVVCAACPFTSPVLTPGQTYSFTFTKAGKFNLVDPLNKNKKATVTVKAAPASVTLAAAPAVLGYGHTTTLAGTLSTAASGQKVDILAQGCGEGGNKVVATVTTTTGGAFAYQTKPELQTTYQARYKAGAATATSPSVGVAIRPGVAVKRLGRGRFQASIAASQSFVGKAVAFQRYVAVKKRWSTVRTVFLGGRSAAATPLAHTTISSATFRARLVRGLRVRLVLPPGQAAPCYLAANSATIRS